MSSTLRKSNDGDVKATRLKWGKGGPDGWRRDSISKVSPSPPFLPHPTSRGSNVLESLCCLFQVLELRLPAPAAATTAASRVVCLNLYEHTHTRAWSDGSCVFAGQAGAGVQHHPAREGRHHREFSCLFAPRPSPSHLYPSLRLPPTSPRSSTRARRQCRASSCVATRTAACLALRLACAHVWPGCGRVL